MKALKKFGFAEAKPTPSMFNKRDSIIQMGRMPLRIDILTTIPGVYFSRCYPRRRMALLDGVAVTMIGREDLIRNKKASGRLKDLADVEEFLKPPRQNL